MEKDEEKVRTVKEFLHRHKPALSIGRLPEKTKETFTALAEEKYCNDYGWALTALMEEAAYTHTLAKLLEEVRVISERVSKLEINKPEPKKEIKTVSGRVIKGGE